MTILTAIQEASASAGLKLSFANIKEFQSFMDSFVYADYPINVVVPFTSNGVTTSAGRRKATIPLQGWVLTRIPEEPMDLRSVVAEANYIQPMRAKAIAFISELLEKDIIDPEVENISDSIRPEYAFLEAQVFGVSYTINLPVVGMIC